MDDPSGRKKRLSRLDEWLIGMLDKPEKPCLVLRLPPDHNEIQKALDKLEESGDLTRLTAALLERADLDHIINIIGDNHDIIDIAESVKHKFGAQVFLRYLMGDETMHDISSDPESREEMEKFLEKMVARFLPHYPELEKRLTKIYHISEDVRDNSFYGIQGVIEKLRDNIERLKQIDEIVRDTVLIEDKLYGPDNIHPGGLSAPKPNLNVKRSSDLIKHYEWALDYFERLQEFSRLIDEVEELRPLLSKEE